MGKSSRRTAEAGELVCSWEIGGLLLTTYLRCVRLGGSEDYDRTGVKSCEIGSTYIRNMNVGFSSWIG